tara:strand:+ start:6638 stop:6883 length:246 start_codon:yes stop_codon:yes gene_type:complete
MNKELKEHAHKLCEQIKNLTNELDNNIKSIEETNFLFENVKINPLQVKIKEKPRPPAGKKSVKLDNSMIYWKESLRYRGTY